jgi:type II secretory pathway pseudopilin PulG
MLASRFPLMSLSKRSQHGAILLVMLVIMVIGALALFVSSLSSSTIQISRDKETADALAKAKEALIGRAVADLTSPGSLPCPDANGDGSADLFSGNQCPYYIGKLPWKTLGLPDLRDGYGEELWYALSPNFRDFASVNPINSDTQGTLNITGTTAANSVIAIVFSAGNPLTGQDRSSTSAACSTTGTSIAANLCATNYLEGSNSNLSTAATPNTAYQSAASNSTFNDRMIYITHDQIFAPVEIRIARDAKKCLDDYAADVANTYHRYPWAVPVSDASYPTSYTGVSSTGTFATLFGRLSSTPNIDTTSGGTPDATMPTSWPASCAALGDPTSYFWKNSWNNLVFYQVADGYKPNSGGGASCTAGSGNTTTGNHNDYRAAVLVARQAIGTENRSVTTIDPPTPYLEGLNPHIGSTPTTTFETYRSSDAIYSTVNDLVLCVDGKVNCL